MATNNNNDAQQPTMIHEAFHAQAIKEPTAPCLIDAVTGKVWSYRETQLKVLSLASELRAAGTSADKVVAIFMDPSPRYVVSMLAALSAGGAVSLKFCVCIIYLKMYDFTNIFLTLHVYCKLLHNLILLFSMFH